MHQSPKTFFRAIFTDSLSAAMQAIDHENTDNPLVVDLLQQLSRLLHDSEIIFCWLPSHIEVLPFRVPYGDFKPIVNSFIQKVWQTTLEDLMNQTNKLFSIKPVLG